MQAHGVVRVQDAPALPAHAPAQLGLFAGSKLLIEAGGAEQGLPADQRDAAKEFDKAGGKDPIEIEDAGIKRSVGVALTEIAPHHCECWVGKGDDAAPDEVGIQLDIPIQKQNKGRIAQAPAGIPAPRCGQGRASQAKHLHPQGSCDLR